MAASVTNIFDSTALPLLFALEARGIHVELTADSRLIVEPASRLTADEEAALRAHGPRTGVAHSPLRSRCAGTA